jgi:hypothetical protein
VRSFRFAVLVKGVLDGDQWHEKARRVESLGYNALVAPDHATRRQLLERRDRFGLTYYVVPEKEMEAFAPLARELTSF